MEHQEDRFQAFDKLSLYQQWWKPDTEPKAAIIIVHGSFEHSGRYSDVALYFTSKGYAVYAFDLRGHGKSEGERSFIRSFDMLHKDLESFLLLVRQHQPHKPIFLLGHSAGGLIVISFLITYQPSCLKGVILSAAALKMSKGVPFIIRNFSSLIGYFFPRLKLGKLDTRFLSRDPQVVRSYNNDPLVYKKGLSAGAAAEFIRAIKKVQNQMELIEIPLLILHGTQDRLSDPKGSKQLYRRARTPDKTLKLYEGFYHELFQEPGKEKVFADVISWLDRQL